jgi:hypothetical protein
MLFVSMPHFDDMGLVCYFDLSPPLLGYISAGAANCLLAKSYHIIIYLLTVYRYVDFFLPVD